jgi:hypothetical protein
VGCDGQRWKVVRWFAIELADLPFSFAFAAVMEERVYVGEREGNEIRVFFNFNNGSFLNKFFTNPSVAPSQNVTKKKLKIISSMMFCVFNEINFVKRC